MLGLSSRDHSKETPVGAPNPHAEGRAPSRSSQKYMWTAVDSEVALGGCRSSRLAPLLPLSAQRDTRLRPLRLSSIQRRVIPPSFKLEGGEGEFQGLDNLDWCGLDGRELRGGGEDGYSS